MAAPAARSRLRRAAARRQVIEPSMLAPPKTVVAVTSGEPAGIGPDICLALARRSFPARIVVLGDRGCSESRARQLGLDLR